ncbi:Ubiquitin carboxyl-terminal hydrolase 35 [Mortierella alpina]|uniref:Ubiquitin carboxyl-terminal hydrolase 35 n=1 Tax=Mortierella alpina TaxID=64518 RepID=A0A9P6J4X9_MORAP|nr:Ubiquitin carboxyl-terminal hydrolase 35 [Mortierella alpina]
METIIKGVLAESTLQDKVKSTFIAQLLKQTAGQSKADAAVLLDLALELKLSHCPSRRILGKIPQRLARVHNILNGNTLTDDEKQEIERDMEILRHFGERKCISADEPLDYAIQCLLVLMYNSLPETRPLAMASYIEFLVEHLAVMPIPTSSSLETVSLMTKSAINLLEQCWSSGPDNVFMTIPQLFLRLSDDQRECSLGVGYLLQAIPDIHTSVVDPFVQNLDVTVLWRLEFTVQRLINWLVTTDMTGIGAWIVAIMESLASRGEFVLLRKMADENAYKIARQLAFRSRRHDAFRVLKFLLTGYHHSPVLFHNISKDLVPLLVSCRKSPDDRAFATEVSNLAQTLVIHFGDSDDVGARVQKARIFLDLPTVTRAEALQTMQDYSWKRGLQMQGEYSNHTLEKDMSIDYSDRPNMLRIGTTAGSRRKPAFVQPLGKVGLVNLGNSCFMNSALRALYCSSDLRRAVLVDTLGIDPKKTMTLRLRETFIGLSTSRLSIFTPLMLYKALPEWLNDGHQQDAAEFTQYDSNLLEETRMEDEDPASKRALSSFQGAMVNQIKCSVCGAVSSNKEEFYHLTIPLPKSESADIQDVVDIFPSIEDLNDENSNKYFCDGCGALQNAKRFTMLGSLPQNLILSLNRFEFDVKRSQRIKISTPVLLREVIHMKVQDSHETQGYQLYAVVIHTGESAHHGHYYTYARDDDTLAAGTQGSDPATSTAWLLYNDTSITVSSFEAMQQKLANSRSDTPYMLFLRRMDTALTQKKSKTDLSKMTVSSL